jgi:ABC-2 type transport system permease protein
MTARESLRAVLALARKDLRLLRRNRGALFFSLGWPVMIALFFGLVFGGAGDKGRIPLAAVDEDGTPASARLLERLRGSAGLDVEALPREEAERRVREGRKSAAVIVPKGYGEAEARLFRGATRTVEIAVDPSRKAEGAMLEGILTGAAMQSIQSTLADPAEALRSVDGAMAEASGMPPGPERARTERFLGELRSYLSAVGKAGGAGTAAGEGGSAGSPQGGGWKPVSIERRDLRADRRGPANAFEVTLPQGILWGVIGSALGFALSLVSERTRGTLARLQAAPLSRGHVLAGKALACFATILAVEALLLGLGAAFLGVRPGSWAMLVAAGLAVATCFVGLMMLVAVAGRTEQSAGGLGWAVMMPLAMFGGGMVPLFAMPAWMSTVGTLSPVKWGILALEGATWRGFGWAQMAPPLAVLVAVGVLAFAVGAWLFRGQEG